MQVISEHVLQALVVNEMLDGHSTQIVSPYAQSEHDSCKLQVMCQIVLRMDFQLLGCVHNHSAPLHHVQPRLISNASLYTMKSSRPLGKLNTGVAMSLSFRA